MKHNMKIICKPKLCGKTHDAIKYVNDIGGYLVVRDRKAAQAAQKMGANRFPITYNEFLDSKMRGSFVKIFVLDDAEDFLQFVFSREGMWLAGFTINGSADYKIGKDITNET